MGKHFIDEKQFDSEKMIERICKRKYYKDGEDWDKLSFRVATYVATGGGISAENAGKKITEEELCYWSNLYYNLIKNKVFIPGGRILANAGTGTKNLYNCFIIDIEDSRESIYTTLKEVAEIHAQGGGTGINFSNLREEDAPVCSTGGKASGPVSFMELFDKSAEVIKQGSRRAAMLASLRADHIDILKFIKAKTRGKKLQNFNISVLIPDSLMEAYINKESYVLKGNKEHKEIEAKEIIHEIAEAAWKSGDPGILFIDEINRHNPTPQLGDIVCTNPCGEIPGIDGSSCNLASLNLKNFLVKDARNTWTLDFSGIQTAVSIMVKFLDDVISVSSTGVDRVDTVKDLERKIGIGVMGFADILSYMRIPYDSDGAIILAETLAKVIYKTAKVTSQLLAEEYGVYLGYSEDSIDPLTLDKQEPQRNSNLVSVAPTGSISLISNVNWSIEPYYMLAYKKNFSFGNKKREPEIIMSSTFKEILSEELNEEDFNLVVENVISDGKILIREEYSEELQNKLLPLAEIFKVAWEISPEDSIAIQAAWQKNIDLSISKTVNLPTSATVEDIEDLIVIAWKNKLKGFTVFRDGCREDQAIEIVK